ncbi:hypothetical protein TNCV_5133801 [Trichonephila clavipes]|nr:hypothetical protein TNCV_5133801 [Trichonephila clavipes]
MDRTASRQSLFYDVVRRLSYRSNSGRSTIPNDAEHVRGKNAGCTPRPALQSKGMSTHTDRSNGGNRANRPLHTIACLKYGSKKVIHLINVMAQRKILGSPSKVRFGGRNSRVVRYRIVACLVTSSSTVPLKTRREGERCMSNLSRA